MDNTALIWDLDGTLFDSYRVIIPNAWQVLSEAGIIMDREEIYRFTIRYSLAEFFEKIAREQGTEAEAYLQRYWQLQRQSDHKIPPMNHALETLEEARKRGWLQFVYTHKGKTAHDVLQRMGMTAYFREIITADDGFPRKPSPAAGRTLPGT